MTPLCLLRSVLICAVALGWDGLWSPSGVNLFAEGKVGMTFAAEQVKVESGRRGLYDYETAWKWALSMSKDERASRFAEILRANPR